MLNHFLIKTMEKKDDFSMVTAKADAEFNWLGLGAPGFQAGIGSCRHHVTSLKGTAQVDRRVEHLEIIGDISFVFITFHY